MATVFESAYTQGMQPFLQRFKKEQPVFTFWKDFFFGGAPIYSRTEDILTQYQIKGVSILDDTFRGGSALEFNGVKGFTNKKYTPAYFFYEKTLTRDDFAQTVFGEDPSNPLSDSARVAAVGAQAAWYIRNSYRATIEKMCHDVIFSGKISPVGNAKGDIEFLKADTDFPVTGNIKTLSGTKWDQNNADIYGDLISLTTEQFQKAGAYPTHLVCDATTMNYIIQDTKIQKLLDNKRIQLGDIMVKPISYEGAAEVGKIALPNGCVLTLMTYTGFYKNSEGSTVAYMDAKKIVLCTQNVGQMGYAALEGIDLNGNPVRVPGEEYVSMHRNDDIPVVRKIKYQQAPLPMPQKLDGWLTVTVLS